MTLGIVVVYMAVLLGVSWLAALFQRGKSSEAFLLADKQLPWPLVGVMIAGLAIGGASTIGVAENAYESGLSAGWYNVAWALGPILVGFFLAARVRMTNQKTVSQMLGSVFGPSFELLAAGVQVVINTVIIALQIIAGGAILSVILPNVFTETTGIIFSAVMFAAVAVMGGLLAAGLSNVVNMLVIYLGVVLGVVYLLHVNGGAAGLQALLPAGISGDGSHWFSFVKGMPAAVIIAWCVTMTLQCLPNTGIMQNFIAARTPADARRGAFFGAAIMIPCGFLSAIFGIACRAHFPDLVNTAAALPTMVMTLPPILSGLLLAGLWAADISTATGLLVGVSTICTEDVIFKYLVSDKNRRHRLVITRLVVLLVVLVATLAALRLSGILSTIMVALALYAPYTILLTALYLFPGALRRSSGWLTFLFGAVALVVVQWVQPAWRLFDQAIYSVLLFSLLGFCLALLDRRPVATENLYVNKAVE
ncbi:sodium:solute symporter family protein [Peptococcus simiae]|uniref:Sodium:solute symporter family protein n=1 Tax=Peptococcus simiae TaxID=1643805 RepID=A0ABW9GXV0_9FIRM